MNISELKPSNKKLDFKSFRVAIPMTVTDDVNKQRYLNKNFIAIAAVFYFRLTYFNTGDTQAFQQKVKDQLITDYSEAQEEYNAAILEESKAKTDFKRRKFLKENPKTKMSKTDKELASKETSHWQKIWEDKKTARRNAKKESDEAYKALETHKDEEAKGFVRENDIQKVGSQYKTSWTHLPA